MMLISDFDVASYYPKHHAQGWAHASALSNVVLVTKLHQEPIEHIYVRRMEAKHSGNTKIANALKISLNGTFGKLGSMYSAFYSPDLMLAVTLTGQLNLLTLIYDLEFNPSVKVLSANTDGIMVQYPVKYRSRIERIIAANAERTGFEYEETPYSKVAMKDVNNYIALTTTGKPSAKGCMRPRA
jgi:DNA polymerase elongation subunit (family B)